MTDSAGNEENPQQAEYLKHLYQGSELLLNDKIEEARSELEQASRIDPDDPKCLSLLGLVYFRLDDYEPAKQIYELLVQRFPGEASLRVNLGLVYMKQGHSDRALEEMVRGVSIDPEHQRAYGYLGLLYSERGDHEQAREAFAKAGQEAMVQKMDEVIAAQNAGEPAVAPEISAEALPPDPEPFGSPTGELEPVAAPAPGSPPPLATEAPAPGSPPPLAPAAPAEQMQPLTSDGQTMPVEAAAPVADAALPVEPPPPEPLPPEPLPPLEEEAAPPVAEAAPAEAAPSDPPAAEQPGEPGPAHNFDDEIDAVIDEAVGPREPWPSESGILPPVERAEEPGPQSAGSAPQRGPVAAPTAAPSARVGAAPESEPIFSYATAGLLDMAATGERMHAPLPSTLVFPVEEDGFVRVEALTSYVGELSFEDAHRRSKGQFNDEPMVDSRGRFMKVLGEGVLLCDAGSESVSVLDLFDDFLYLRTEYLFAFESTLHWENGKVRGLTGPIDLIHIRGEGRLALVGADGLRKVRLQPERQAYVSEDGLVGWMGRVSPQTLPRGAAAPEGAVLKPMLRCEGEGVILVRSGSRLAGQAGQAGQAATPRED